MFTQLLFTIGVILLGYALYRWGTRYNNYFNECGVQHLEPIFLFGNMFGFFLNKYSGPEFISMIYNKFPTERIIGMFDFRTPKFVIRDPEIIKQLAIKDFDYFEDHQPFVDDSIDPLLGNSLFMLKGEKWREMRATLSPAFTGSKMRQMFQLVSECAHDLANHFLSEGKTGMPINNEMKDLFSRYTNDVIASCAFGIKVNSLVNTENEFLLAGRKIMEFTSPLAGLKIMISKLFPLLAKALNVTVIEKPVSTFFRSMIFDTMNTRKERNIYRPDMINILMQVRQSNFKSKSTEQNLSDSGDFASTSEQSSAKATVQQNWSDDEIAAQCFLFFVAGFETTSTMLTFASYELAINLDVQSKLYKEIKKINDSLNAKQLITYDALHKMKYLDQVVSESLRKWPPAVLTDRVCNRQYQFDDGDKLKFRIEKGFSYWIPIYGLHHDPKFFPNPEKFNPERFSDENKSAIVPCSYVPFGAGPRNCIGSRFALMEIKAVLYYLLLNFSIEPNSQTQIPIQIKKTPMGLAIEDGLQLEFKPRT